MVGLNQRLEIAHFYGVGAHIEHPRRPMTVPTHFPFQPYESHFDGYVSSLWKFVQLYIGSYKAFHYIKQAVFLKFATIAIFPSKN